MDDLVCGNQDHPRPAAAIARLFWPDGRYAPTTACATDLPGQIRQSLDEGHPVEVWPVRKEPDNPLRFGTWRRAPDCARCNDTGRFREGGEATCIVEAPCTCKRGRRMSELWYAEKHGFGHPDEPEPDYDPEGPPF